MTIYKLYGLELISDYPFLNHLYIKTQTPDAHEPQRHQVLFNVIRGDSRKFRPSNWDNIYPKSTIVPQDGTRFRLFRKNNQYLLEYGSTLDFYFKPGLIQCSLYDVNQAFLVEIQLLGLVLSLYLETLGIPTLHASAVVINNEGLGFLASNKGGKTTLAASLVSAGHSLLTDDILAIDPSSRKVTCRPGYPTMRMWPEVAEQFVGTYEYLDTVHPKFDKRRVPVSVFSDRHNCQEDLPLRCLYVPERRNVTEIGNSVTVIPVDPKEALLLLLRNSFAPLLVNALGTGSERLRVFSEVARNVPMRRLIYPSGFTYLPSVIDAIFNNIKE